MNFAEADAIELADLPEHIGWPGGIPVDAPLRPSDPAPTSGTTAADIDGTFKDAKERWISAFERDYIASLIRKNNGNISHASREAQIDRKYFRKLMKKYGSTAQEDGQDDDD